MTVRQSIICSANLRLLEHCQRSFRLRLLEVERRFKASHPDLPVGVYHFLRDKHERALALLDPDAVLRAVRAIEH